MDDNARPAIPLSIQREVRRKCGFGCVICGCPVYDYDHIEEYFVVKEHTAENLVLLCPTHHRKKTKGLLTKETVKAALGEAAKRNRTLPDEISFAPYILDVGGNLITSFSGVPLSITNFCYVQVKYGKFPLIDAVFLNENGNTAIKIEENVYTLGCDTWDIEYVGNSLTFRNGPGKMFAKLVFEANQGTIRIRCNVKLRDGVRVKVNDDGIFANDLLLLKENRVTQCKVGMVITDGEVGPALLNNSHVSDNFFYNNCGIGALNCHECSNNTFIKCDWAFAWTENFLRELGKEKRRQTSK